LEASMTADHSRYVEQFEESEDITKDARQKSERDRDYRDNKQLTDTEERTLRDRGQPVVVFNEIQPKVNTMLGLEKQTRKDPKALPRTPQDEKSAHAVTDAIRYVCEDCNWDDIRSRAADNLVVEGTCAVMVGQKQARNAIDPDIRRIPWDRFYYDPASSELDFSDALFMGTVIWMDLDAAKRKFPDAAEVLENTWLEARTDETYGDKPRNHWADYKRRRVRLIEHYCNDGGWKFCIATKAGFVTPLIDSPYLDADGVPECPIKAVSLYIDRDNNRFGEVRFMVSPQDEVNKRRSKALHLISQQRLRVSPNVAQDPEKVRQEMTRADGVFIGETGDVEFFQNNDMAVGNLNLLQDARAHIHRTGANNAMAGKDTEGQSGRAIIAQQQGGMVESAGYLDAIRILSIAVYRSVWARVRQNWTAERWIRVTDDQRNLQFVGLNRPVTMLEKAQSELDPNDPAAAMYLQELMADPMAQAVVDIENNVADLDVDIIIEEGIDTPTIAAEQWTELVTLASSGIPIPPKLLIEASSLRDKEKLLQELEQPPDPQMVQFQQMMQQLQAMLAQAEVRKTESEAIENEAQAQAITVGAQVQAFQAGAQVGAQ
jgi:hypothetical protein